MNVVSVVPSSGQIKPPAPVLAPEPDRPPLLFNILWLYGLQGLNYLIPIAMLPYLVRVLGVEQYGLIAFAQTIAQYFTIASDYGFNYSVTRSIAQHRQDPTEVARVFWTTFTIKLFFLALGAALLAGIVIASPLLLQHKSVYFAAYVSVIGNGIFPVWLFQGLEQMRSISIITGLAKLASLALVVLFVHRSQDTFLATLLISSGYLFAGAIGLIVALKGHVGRYARPTRKDLFASLRDGRHLFLTTAAISLYSNTNTLLVGLISGTEQAGYFSLADKIIRAFTALVAPIIQAAYPHVVRLVAKSRGAAVLFLRATVRRGALLGLLMGLSILLLARPISSLAFGRAGSTVVPLVQALSFFPLFGCLNFILGTLVLMPFGYDREQSRFLIGAGLLNVVLGLLLIPRYGALGGVIGMSAIEALQTAGSALILYYGQRRATL